MPSSSGRLSRSVTCVDPGARFASFDRKVPVGRDGRPGRPGFDLRQSQSGRAGRPSRPLRTGHFIAESFSGSDIERSTSNAGRWAFRGRDRVPSGVRAFTLLEILITLALIALLAGALVAGAGRLLKDQPTTPAEIFRKALTEARQYAIEKNVEVRLSFDAKNRVFTASTREGTRSYPVAGDADLAIDFLAAQKGGSTVLIAGVLVETQTVPYVTFYPDGTCSPFRVQFRMNGNASVTAIDPWTCAPVLETKTTTG